MALPVEYLMTVSSNAETLGLVGGGYGVRRLITLQGGSPTGAPDDLEQDIRIMVLFAKVADSGNYTPGATLKLTLSTP